MTKVVDFSLKGKVALITGGSRGIGRAIALAFAENGADIAVSARNLPDLEAVAAEIEARGQKCLPVVAHVGKVDESKALLEKVKKQYGRIDILVNNAGRGHFASVEDTTDEMIRSMFELNVYPLWYTTRPALTQMKKQGSGHIINIASMAGKIGYPYNSAYVAAKHACVGFTHALRMELMETGIHATVVCPAGVLTGWAGETEGGSMLEFFSASGPAIKRLASERGISLPAIEGVLPAEDVAAQIVKCIYNPVAELFTHKGSAEFLRLIAENREEAEKHQIPVVLGERAVYERLKA